VRTPRHTTYVQDDITFNPYTITVNASGSANTKGSYTTIAAAIAMDIAGALLCLQLGSAQSSLQDISVGSAGNEKDVVPNWWHHAPAGSTHVCAPKFIPFTAKGGVRISTRMQAGAGSYFFHLKVIFLAASLMGIDSPKTWKDWGTTLASSVGTTVNSGAANTKGAYISLVAATDFTTRWIMFTCGGTVDDIATDIAVGSAGNEVVVIPNFYNTSETSRFGLLLPLKIKGGVRIAIRCAAAGGAGSGMTIQILGGA